MEYGNIEISDSVLKEIAVKSLADFQGLDISDPKEAKKLRKAVEIERLDSETLSVNVRVAVKFGEVIPEYVKKLQDKLSKDLEALTGMKVASVNVTVEEVLLEGAQEYTAVEESKTEGND